MEVAMISFGVGALIFSSYFFTHLFHRFQIPDVVFLVAIGLLLGPIFGIIDVRDFGTLGSFFVTLTLLVILFEAGLEIKLKGLLASAPRATILMLLTLLTTAIIVLPIGMYVLGISFIESLLVGILLGGVSAGLAVPLLEKLPVKEETRSFITFEANINDVFTVGLVFAVVDFANGEAFSFTTFSTSFGASLFISFLIGALAALMWSQIILRVRNIHNNIFMTPALVLVVFGLTELLGASGVFAAFAFGIILGNLQFLKWRRRGLFSNFQEFSLTKWEKRMFSGFVFLLKTYFFVYIGLSIGFEDWYILLIGFSTVLLLFIMRMFLVRGVVGRSVPEFDVLTLSRILPKGLMGAALVTLIDNPIAQDFTYSVILFSILITSGLVFLLPRQSESMENPRPAFEPLPIKTSPRKALW